MDPQDLDVFLCMVHAVDRVRDVDFVLHHPADMCYKPV